MSRYTHLLGSVILLAAGAAVSTSALAVGGGLPFRVDESKIPGADPNIVATPDSLDFTYHACTLIDPVTHRLTERGYAWLSSYQDADSVIDSQLNYVNPTGYRLYVIYDYSAPQWNGVQPAPGGGRRVTYAPADSGTVSLYIDLNSDTDIEVSAGCDTVRTVGHDSDDHPLGIAPGVGTGMKSETNSFAQGDFKIHYIPWTWTPYALNHWLDTNPPALPVPYANFGALVFNANVTRILGPLRDNHRTEGSGNLFWLQ